MPRRDIERRQKSRVFLGLLLGAVVVAIAGILIAAHVQETTHEVNVPGQKLK